MMFLGPNELQAICSEEKPTEEKVVMMMGVLKVLLKVPKCSYYTKLAYTENLFSVSHGVDDIMKLKNLPKTNHIIVRNLTYCLHGIRLVNRVYNGIITMKQETIQHTNDNHVALLESLWVNMKPNTPRTGDSKTVFSPDWMLLGFQGKDPTTDFRSLGLLGLYQLVYFSLHRTTTAHMVLDQMSTTGNYYPFAVIGINISQFVMELFHEYRLHKKIFENFRDITMACSNLVRDTLSDDANCINYCTETIHDIYCLIFEEFFMLWVVRHPADIMSFSDLFNELKQDIRNRYPAP